MLVGGIKLSVKVGALMSKIYDDLKVIKPAGVSVARQRQTPFWLTG